MSNVHLRAAAVGVLALVAACGGSGSAGTPTAATAAPTTATSDGAGTDSPTPDGAPSVQASTSVPEPPSGGGGTAANVCELVTEEELAGILGTAVNLTVFTGPPDTCDIQSTDGAPLAATVFLNVGGSFAYDAFAGDSGSVDVAGIGEKASYSEGQGLLVVFKNGAMLSVAVFDDGSRDAATRRGLMEQIGRIAAGRM